MVRKISPVSMKDCLPSVLSPGSEVLQMNRIGMRIAFNVMFGFLLGSLRKEDGRCLYISVCPSYIRKDASESRYTNRVTDGGWLQFGTPNTFNVGSLLGETSFKAVVVMPAYRVNLFGFLYSAELEEDAATAGETVGNHGFWDQRLALEWTKENAHLFGGNGKNITISGYSAGTPAIQSNPTFILTGSRRILSLPPTLPRPPATSFEIHNLASMYLVQRTRCPTQTTPGIPNTIRPASLGPKHPSLLTRTRQNIPPSLPPSKDPPKRSQLNANPPIPTNNGRRFHLRNPPQIPRRRLICAHFEGPKYPNHARRMQR